MNKNQTNEHRPDTTIQGTFGHRCRQSCERILARIRKAKDALFAESRLGPLKAQEQMLKLALNEAEALAWLTAYPHLVFPDLAREKIDAVARWHKHQQDLDRFGRAPLGSAMYDWPLAA